MSQSFEFTDGDEVSAPAATLVSSWGGEISNTYVTLTEANSFIGTAVVDATKWSASTTAQRSAALLQATVDVDAHTYLGERYFTTQRLEFPRAFHSFPDDFTQLSSGLWSTEQAILYDDVKKAQCHQALWLLRASGRQKHLENQAYGVESFSRKIGPIEDSVKYRGDTSRSKVLCPEALALLQKWMMGRRIFRG